MRKLLNSTKAGFSSVISLFIILIIISGGLYLYNQQIKTPCQQTIYYDIGSVDSRFNISKADLITETKQAETVWEDPFNHNFFQYKPGADFKVNLVYDSRQANATARKSLDDSINTQKSHYETLKDQYNAQLKSYQTAQASYNAEVNKWNSQGGAPAADYQRLNNEKKSLDTQLAQINNLARQLNQASQDINANVSQYNASAGDTFRQGEYVDEGGNKYLDMIIPSHKYINVYEFQSNNELELVLAHELGHALGLSHVKDPGAIMNAVLAGQDLNNIQLTQADKDELTNLCKVSK